MMVSLKTLLEKLGKDATAGDYVKDFKKSDAPQFKGKSDKKKHKMAIAAYLDAKDKEKSERVSTVDVDQKKRDLAVAKMDKKIKDLKTEAYKGNVKDLRYDLDLAMDELGLSRKGIKKVTKKGKGYEIRMANWMSSDKYPDFLAKQVGAKVTSWQPGGRGQINIMTIESVNEGKAYGPTGIAYAVKSGHPDEVDPRTRKKYPERQTAKYKKQWAKNNKESVSFNEISAKMLNRYYDKAKTSHDKAANSAFARHLRKEPGVDKDLAVADRRKKGIKLAKNRAIRRLRGEIK